MNSFSFFFFFILYSFLDFLSLSPPQIPNVSFFLLNQIRFKWYRTRSEVLSSTLPTIVYCPSFSHLHLFIHVFTFTLLFSY